MNQKKKKDKECDSINESTYVANSPRDSAFLMDKINID